MNVMEIRGLCKAYPAFTLKDVSFTVPQGAVMGFIGRNGAGKSTTIKSVLGLVHPDAGQVEILGRSFTGGEKFIKENIGVVLGGIDFYPKKTIATLTDVVRRFYENWDHFACPQGESRVRLAQTPDLHDVHPPLSAAFRH